MSDEVDRKRQRHALLLVAVLIVGGAGVAWLLADRPASGIPGPATGSQTPRPAPIPAAPQATATPAVDSPPGRKLTLVMGQRLTREGSLELGLTTEQTQRANKAMVAFANGVQQEENRRMRRYPCRDDEAAGTRAWLIEADPGRFDGRMEELRTALSEIAGGLAAGQLTHALAIDPTLLTLGNGDVLYCRTPLPSGEDKIQITLYDAETGESITSASGDGDLLMGDFGLRPKQP